MSVMRCRLLMIYKNRAKRTFEARTSVQHFFTVDEAGVLSFSRLSFSCTSTEITLSTATVACIAVQSMSNVDRGSVNNKYYA
jgi:hypothetical protein